MAEAKKEEDECAQQHPWRRRGRGRGGALPFLPQIAEKVPASSLLLHFLGVIPPGESLQFCDTGERGHMLFSMCQKESRDRMLFCCFVRKSQREIRTCDVEPDSRKHRLACPILAVLVSWDKNALFQYVFQQSRGGE